MSRISKYKRVFFQSMKKKFILIITRVCEPHRHNVNSDSMLLSQDLRGIRYCRINGIPFAYSDLGKEEKKIVGY